jgi:hypothetical protein
MTSAQSSSPVRAEDDDVLLREFLGGSTQLVYSGFLRTADGRGVGGTYVYHISSGWTVVTRPGGWKGCSLLSLDHPGLMVSGPERWRRKVLEASKQVEGASILPVSFASYWQAAGVDRDKPPHVIEINDQYETVFRIKQRYYLSGYDTQEQPRPLYFLCRLPHKVATIKAARESLKPKSVKAALRAGLNVERQGDIFAIESDFTTADMKEMGAEFKAGQPIYGTAHTATDLVRLPNGVMFAKGTLIHEPIIINQHRGRDHGPRLLPGERWWWLTRNTVPVADPSLPPGNAMRPAMQTPWGTW